MCPTSEVLARGQHDLCIFTVIPNGRGDAGKRSESVVWDCHSSTNPQSPAISAIAPAPQ
jgi:hypothetical protein